MDHTENSSYMRGFSQHMIALFSRALKGQDYHIQESQTDIILLLKCLYRYLFHSNGLRPNYSWPSYSPVDGLFSIILPPQMHQL